MARGIMIFGGSGSGKSTLGRITAQKMNWPYFDLDDYIWQKDTAVPFTQMYSREEKISRLMADISQDEHFVMAGSMSSFHEAFDPFFDLMVFLDTDTELRLTRLHQRELEEFGERILEGGDMYEEHQSFLKNSARYDSDGSPNRQAHLLWAESVGCPLLKLNGVDSPEENADKIVQAFGK